MSPTGHSLVKSDHWLYWLQCVLNHISPCFSQTHYWA